MSQNHTATTAKISSSCLYFPMSYGCHGQAGMHRHTKPTFKTQILLYLLLIIFIATYNIATLSRWYIHSLEMCYWNASFEGAREELCQWVHIFSWTYKLLAVGTYSVGICHLANHHPITEKTTITLIIMQWY